VEVAILGPSGREQWDAYVSACPHSVAWQLWEWSEVVAAQYGLELSPLAAMEGGSIRGILPLYAVKDREGLSDLVSVPHAVAGGIAADSPEAEAALLSGAVDLAGRMGATRITLKQYKCRIAGDLKTDDSYVNRELRLGADLDAVLRTVSDENRRQIERAGALSPSLEYPCQDIDGFYRLLSAHEHRSGVPCPGVAWVHALLGTGMYRVAMLRVGGRVLAATLVKAFKDTISFPYTCLGPGAEAGVAVYRLYWELICVHASSGARIFHSGRMPRVGSVHAYRQGWGGDPHPYFYQYWPSSVERTESSTKRGGKRALLQAAWKRLPGPVVRALGPRIVRRFP
jgi:hypothetical protein